MREKAGKWVLVLFALGILLLLLILLILFPRRGHQRPALLEVTVITREEGKGPGANLRQGMEQAAADLNVELRFLLPAAPGDGESQRQLLRREVESGAQAILLLPADRVALGEEVSNAAARAALVTLETDMTGKGAGGFVGVDNTALGQTAARAALNGVREGETVLLLDSAPGDNGVRERLLAAEALLREQGRVTRRCGPDTDTALTILLETELAEGGIKGVVVFEASALEEASACFSFLETPPLLYGMGSTTGVIAGLERGTITAAVAQNDFSAGYLAVEQAAALARGRPVKDRGELTFFTVRKENLYEPEYQKLLFPMTR